MATVCAVYAAKFLKLSTIERDSTDLSEKPIYEEADKCQKGYIIEPGRFYRVIAKVESEPVKVNNGKVALIKPNPLFAHSGLDCKETDGIQLGSRTISEVEFALENKTNTSFIVPLKQYFGDIVVLD